MLNNLFYISYTLKIEKSYKSSKKNNKLIINVIMQNTNVLSYYSCIHFVNDQIYQLNKLYYIKKLPKQFFDNPKS